jgi:lysylphosphatidylglycerol synthetase-like protein (DUF2156 family)
MVRGSSTSGTTVPHTQSVAVVPPLQVVGYCANILRRDPEEKPSYILDFMIMSCVEKFRAEGIEFLALAPAPLHGVDGHTDGEASFVRTLFRVSGSEGCKVGEWGDLGARSG